MSTIISFDATTSREIDALEAANAARRAAAENPTATEPTPEEA